MQNKESQNLRECPFCGSENVHFGYHMPKHGEKVMYFVCCDACRCRTDNYRNKSIPADIWNRRHTPRQELEFDYEAED